jgi:hypothetical protein
MVTTDVSALCSYILWIRVRQVYCPPLVRTSLESIQRLMETRWKFNSCKELEFSHLPLSWFLFPKRNYFWRRYQLGLHFTYSDKKSLAHEMRRRGNERYVDTLQSMKLEVFYSVYNFSHIYTRSRHLNTQQTSALRWWEGFQSTTHPCAKLFLSSLYVNLLTEHRGQALSVALCIREVPGSNPGAAGLIWRGFFQHILICWVSIHPSVRTTLLPHPSLPYASRIVGEKVLESLSSPLSLAGNEKLHVSLLKDGFWFGCSYYARAS